VPVDSGDQLSLGGMRWTWDVQVAVAVGSVFLVVAIGTWIVLRILIVIERGRRGSSGLFTPEEAHLGGLSSSL